MKFILLHLKSDGEKIYINRDAIETLRRIKKDDKTMVTTIGCEDGWFDVRETPEEILQMIRGGE